MSFGPKVKHNANKLNRKRGPEPSEIPQDPLDFFGNTKIVRRASNRKSTKISQSCFNLDNPTNLDLELLTTQPQLKREKTRRALESLEASTPSQYSKLAQKILRRIEAYFRPNCGSVGGSRTSFAGYELSYIDDASTILQKRWKLFSSIVPKLKESIRSNKHYGIYEAMIYIYNTSKHFLTDFDEVEGLKEYEAPLEELILDLVIAMKPKILSGEFSLLEAKRKQFVSNKRMAESKNPCSRKKRPLIVLREAKEHLDGTLMGIANNMKIVKSGEDINHSGKTRAARKQAGAVRRPQKDEMEYIERAFCRHDFGKNRNDGVDLNPPPVLDHSSYIQLTQYLEEDRKNDAKIEKMLKKANMASRHSSIANEMVFRSGMLQIKGRSEVSEDYEVSIIEMTVPSN